jgi:hypothetical protein
MTLQPFLDAGFIFWGLFLTFASVVVAYVVWMLWVERP